MTHCPDTLLNNIGDMPLMESPCVVIVGTVHYSHLNLFSGVNWGDLDTHCDVLDL